MTAAYIRVPDIADVRHLYKSVSSCADHHDSDMMDKLHISTAIDDAVVMGAKQGKVVIVTGNTGDGKTHLINRIADQLSASIRVNKDANQSEDSEIIQSIDASLSSKTALVLAINEGILLEVCEQAKSRYPWAHQIIDAILHPYVYDDHSTKDLDGILILDLSLRNNLAGAVVGQAIDKVAGLADKSDDPMVKANADAIRHSVVKERIALLLDNVARSGFHATMRELLGFLAYVISGGEDREAGTPTEPYYVNAFEGGQGPLFDMVRQFDPLTLPSPFIDDKLFMAQDRDADWEISRPEEIRSAEDMSLFRRRKRRAYFEHKQGQTILRGERSEVDRIFGRLTRTDQAPEEVAIQLLNRFYDSKNAPTDQLTLWVSHQYNARPIRYVASRQVISASEFEVRVPRLPPHLRDVFADHHPDHVVLSHKSMPQGEGLVIDRRLVSMLIAGDRLAGLGTRNFEAQTKIASFYDALAKVSPSQHSVVQVMRLDNLMKVRVGVNIGSGEYYIPGG